MALWFYYGGTAGGNSSSAVSYDLNFAPFNAIAMAFINGHGFGDSGQTGEVGIIRYKYKPRRGFTRTVDKFSPVFGALTPVITVEGLSQVTLLIRCYSGWVNGAVVVQTW